MYTRRPPGMLTGRVLIRMECSKRVAAVSPRSVQTFEGRTTPPAFMSRSGVGEFRVTPVGRRPDHGAHPLVAAPASHVDICQVSAGEKITVGQRDRADHMIRAVAEDAQPAASGH